MTLARLNQAELDRIKKAKPVFQAVEKITGVPWQAIASVWYRESFSVTPPHTPGGPFQFDPVPPAEKLMKYLKIFTKLSDDEARKLVAAGVNSFQAGAVFAACHMRWVSKFNLAEDHSDTAIKDAFYGYNGRAFDPYPESSNYVVNELDAKHDDMGISGTIPDGHGGKKWIRATDHRPGAFTVYRQIVDLGL